MKIREKIYKYFSDASGGRVLFVFDPLDGLRTEIEEDTTEWQEGYVYKVFEGDWFTTKIKLRTEWADKKVVLLFDHRFPEPNPRDQQTCRQFQLMGAMMSNAVFHEEDEKAFMDQRHISQEYYDFVRRHLNELHRERFNRILSPYYGKSSFSLDVAHRGIISGYLGSTELLDWHKIVAQLIIMSDKYPKRADSFFMRLASENGKENARDIAESLNEELLRVSGQKVEMNQEQKIRGVAESLKYNAITQNLTTAANDPYRNLKVNSIAQTQAIAQWLGNIRDNSRLEAQFRPAFEKLTSNIREEEIIRVYGADADYGYWPDRLCELIIANTVEENLPNNPAKAIERLEAISKHIEEDSPIAKKLQFSLAAARYFLSRKGIGSLRLNTPDLYVERYTKEFYLLDQYYRQAVGAYAELGMDRLSQKTEDVKMSLDNDYAAFQNDLNLEWVGCLKEFGKGLESLNDSERQQDFYEKNVRRQENKVAVIVSDALRYELAAELMQQLQGTKHVATLRHALAMLPTETKYCKPALLPHKTLHCTGDDLEVDGKVLASTESRSAQLQKYNAKALCVDYKKLLGLSFKGERREVFKNQIVYVFHNTIDEGGHDSSAKSFTSACRNAIEELRQLVAYLHNNANVSDVFITADHGFLFNDQVFEEKDKQKVDEICLESKTRYYITSSPQDKEGITKFKLSEVSAMTGDYYVAVPLGTNRLAAPAGGYAFAHGGAALQELIIPIVHSKYKRENEKEKVGVELLEPSLSIISSRLKVHLVQKEAVDMERTERKIVCGLYREGKPVGKTEELTLAFTDGDAKRRTVELNFNVSLSESGGILQFKVFDQADELNALISANVINHTLIEQDDF